MKDVTNTRMLNLKAFAVLFVASVVAMGGRAAILSWSRWREPSAIVSSPSRNITYSPSAVLTPLLRSADVSTPTIISQSANGWFRTESKHSRTYGSTSQQGIIIEKNGLIFVYAGMALSC